MHIRTILLPCTLIFFSLIFSGCMNVATTGAQAIYNRHSIQKSLTDQYIHLQANQALYFKTKAFQDTHLTLTTYNADVLIVGQVTTAAQKAQVTKIIKAIPEVNTVINLATISTPTSTLIRMSDTWLTAKVKSKLIASDDVDATKVTVVTENGTVYLMGTLPPEEAAAAVEITRTTAGVVRVVKIFSYIRISKT